jgi:hypothetical protein
MQWKCRIWILQKQAWNTAAWHPRRIAVLVLRVAKDSGKVNIWLVVSTESVALIQDDNIREVIPDPFTYNFFLFVVPGLFAKGAILKLKTTVSN